MISTDKKYTTKNNSEVKLYSLDNGGLYPIHGAIKNRDKWHISEWDNDGLYNVRSKHDLDLIEVWEPQDKEPIWAWDIDEFSHRIFRYWDKNLSRGY